MQKMQEAKNENLMSHKVKSKKFSMSRKSLKLVLMAHNDRVQNRHKIQNSYIFIIIRIIAFSLNIFSEI